MCLSNPRLKMKLKFSFFCLWLSFFGGACQQQLDITPTLVKCGEYRINTGFLPDCLESETGTLIQAPLNQQVQLYIGDTEITIRGTAFLNSSNTIVAVLEGTSLVNTQSRIITLNSGDQLLLDNPESSNLEHYDIDEINSLPLTQLKRQIILPFPTATPVVIPTEIPDCPFPDEWTDTYQVQAGDNLTSIAELANVSLADIQTFNCINNPDNLRVGTTLRVPINSILPTQPVVTFTPSAVFFRADSDTLSARDCTNLRWDVQNVRDIRLDEVSVMNRTSQEICPTVTTTYTLTVHYFDDTQSEHQVTVTVQS